MLSRQPGLGMQFRGEGRYWFSLNLSPVSYARRRILATVEPNQASAGYAAHRSVGTTNYLCPVRRALAFHGANQANHRLFVAFICSLRALSTCLWAPPKG